LHEAYGSVALVMLSTRGLAAGECRIVQIQLDPDNWDDHDPWSPAHSTANRGGVVADIIANPEPRIVQRVEWAGDPVFGELLEGYCSVMAIPIASEALPMTWILYLKQAPQRFTTSELAEAMLRIAIIGSLLDSKSVEFDLASANERIDQDMQQVAELQRSLLPNPLPRIPGLEIAASYRPCCRAGGDIYDLFPLDRAAPDRDRWCVFIGDVAGHGLPAAVVMAMVQSILRAHPQKICGPACLLEHINRHLCRKSLGGFVTAFLGIYEPASRRLSYACAGHPPPLVKSAARGTVSRLNGAAGFPLGIEPMQSFSQACAYAHLGDSFLLYTDGITEARGPNHEMLSTEKLEHLFNQCPNHPALLIDSVRELVKSHERGGLPADDQTMVAMLAI
jgi:sigma-B regulation protein RsbU (phosphoserine phosphatase)